MRAAEIARSWLALAVPMVLAVLGSDCRCAPQSPETIVLISIDTTRRDHLSVYGYGRPTSPNAARLAADGVVFTDAVAVHTNTTPTHASMLTGLYPLRHGSINNGILLADDVPTLAEILDDAGYATAAFVSGGPLRSDLSGLQRGFDHYDDEMRRHHRDAEVTIARASRWLEDRAADDRIFIFVHLYDPHQPYNPLGEFAGFARGGSPAPELQTSVAKLRVRHLQGERSDELDAIYADLIRRYDAEIAYADDAVGDLLDDLQRVDRYDHATIFYTADHGETLLERRWIFDHGARVTDEQARVPLILKLPASAHAGARVVAQVSQVDLMPTILQRYALEEPEAVQGRSLLPLLGRPREVTPTPVFILARRVPRRLTDLGIAVPQETKHGDPAGLIAAVRLPPYKLVDYGPMDPRPTRVLRDLRRDPGEERDATQEAPEVAAALSELLARWLDGRGDGAGTTPEISDISEAAREELRALGYVE